MNQNFNNFNFIGFNDILNRRNDNNPRPTSRRNPLLGDYLPPQLQPYLNNANYQNVDYLKLKKQFIKELDEFQYKNKDKFDSSLVESECSICLCKYKITDILKILPCSHPFHKKCIKKWLSNEDHNKCPLCNRDIKSEVLKRKAELEKHIHDEENDDDDESN